MQKSFNFFYAFLLAILGFGATLMAEDITLTTYYPAPYGAYDELSTTGNTYLATTSGNVGIGASSASSKLDVTGTVDATAYSVDGTAGASGTFISQDGKTITVTDGLITNITP